MLAKIGISLMFVATAVTGAAAQAQPTLDLDLDIAVSEFLEKGLRSSWQPNLLFRGCPELAQWQEEGFRMLASANLSNERTGDLALIWSRPLRECNDGRLEQWYFDRLDAAIQRGEWGRTLNLRTPIYKNDTPRIREYFRAQMLNTSLPDDVRNTSGSVYFEKLGRDEFMVEFLRAFETAALPWQLSWGQATRLLEQDADRLLLEVAKVLQRDPRLADQTAFAMIVEGSRRHASERARSALADALAMALEREASAIDSRLRARLENNVHFLRGRSR